MQILQNSVHVRQFSELDYSFILNSYLKSYRIQEANRFIENCVYYDNYKKLFDKLLKRGDCLVACNPDDLDQLYAWVLFETIDDTTILHFAYTKYTYRKMGIMETLFRMAGISKNKIICSHAPIMVHKIKDKIIFNPFLR